MAAMSQDTPSVAGLAVIDTAELREMILLQLDNKTLLLSQRVSKNFKSSIEQCEEIQIKLFFRRGPQASLIKRVTLHEGNINPLLSRKWAADKLPPRGLRTRSMPPICCVPGLELRINHSPPRFHSGQFQMCTEVHLTQRVQTVSSVVKSTGEESWRRMYLFKPGVKAAPVNVRVEKERRDGGYVHVRDLRMADLYQGRSFEGLVSQQVNEWIKENDEAEQKRQSELKEEAERKERTNKEYEEWRAAQSLGNTDWSQDDEVQLISSRSVGTVDLTQDDEDEVVSGSWRHGQSPPRSFALD